MLFDRRVQLTCAQCGKDFSTPKSKADKGAKYCGAECFERACQKRVECICEVCNKKFELRPGDINEGHGKFCGWQCYNKFRTKRFSQSCQECGKTFETLPAKQDIGKGKYCSKECANRAIGRERRRLLESFICENCGKSFEAKQTPAQAARGARQYCSQECFAKARRNRIEKSCEQCGKKIYLTPAAIALGQGRFCSKNCQIRYRGETSIEHLIRKELERRNEPFESQVQFKRYFADFVLPLRRAVIECDGKNWHSKLGVFARDQRKDEYLKSLGYRVFRFSDQEIRNSPTECLNQVLALAPVISTIV